MRETCKTRSPEGMSAGQQNGGGVELRDRIEELAKRWVLRDPESGASENGEWAAELAGIRDCARSAGNESLAHLAGVLAEEAENGGGSADSCRAIEEGLGRLEAALVQEAAAPAPPSNSLAQDPELAADFAAETREHLANIETQLLTLEREPSASEPVHAIFRSFHTVKGLAGFLEFETIREVAPEIETVLDKVRDGSLGVTPALIDAILAGADFLTRETGAIERALASGGAPQFSAPPDALLVKIRGLLENPATAPKPGMPASLQKLSEAVADVSAPPEPAAEAAAEPAPEQRKATTGKTAESVIKVDTGRLDYLVDMVGELVVAQSLVRHNPDLEENHSVRLLSDLAQLTRITQEVQKTAMSMRMVPIGHMFRNAADHGIESAAERAAAGKHPVARIQLRASHQAGHILIEIRDDGRGIDREKVLSKARERGIVADNTRLSDNDILNLVFEPGFSTADQVTDISGRGVGMDVVKKHVQRIRGHVDIESTLGQGTRFLLKVPLTLAIIDGLVVGVGNDRYILPIFAVKEMIRPEPGTLSRYSASGEVPR